MFCFRIIYSRKNSYKNTILDIWRVNVKIFLNFSSICCVCLHTINISNLKSFPSKNSEDYKDYKTDIFNKYFVQCPFNKLFREKIT